MAERNQKVLDRVRQELAKAPELGSSQLYELAKKVDAAIGSDTLQQFHARYVLPYRREQSKKAREAAGEAKPARRARKPRAAVAVEAPAPVRRRGRKAAPVVSTVSDRERVRGILLGFAQAFAKAESKPQVVEVMTRLDDYVSELLKR